MSPSRNRKVPSFSSGRGVLLSSVSRGAVSPIRPIATRVEFTRKELLAITSSFMIPIQFHYGLQIPMIYEDSKTARPLKDRGQPLHETTSQ